MLTSLLLFKPAMPHCTEDEKEPYLGSKLPLPKAPLSSRDHQVSEGLVGLSYCRVTKFLKF